ncbi:heme-binding protein, partial [Escherichia coli]|nr:heme-binding protein [Escherichia coli]
MGGSGTMKVSVSVVLSLLSVSVLGSVWSDNKNVGTIPPTCKRIECPSHDIIEVGNGYQIRRYNSTVWISNPPIQDISLVEATRTGFLRLFDYIQGKNNYKQKIEMTAPVITEVSPSDGPFCKSSFVVSFFVPKENQANPPPAKGLHVQRWKTVYVAV